MPPLNFCYWRCYSTEPKSFRKLIKIYAGDRAQTVQIAAHGVLPGTCSSIDDMFYCGHSCDVCDYDY